MQAGFRTVRSASILDDTGDCRLNNLNQWGLQAPKAGNPLFKIVPHIMYLLLWRNYQNLKIEKIGPQEF